MMEFLVEKVQALLVGGGPLRFSRCNIPGRCGLDKRRAVVGGAWRASRGSWLAGPVAESAKPEGRWEVTKAAILHTVGEMLDAYPADLKIGAPLLVAWLHLDDDLTIDDLLPLAPHIRRVERVPLNPTGKPDRDAVRGLFD